LFNGWKPVNSRVFATPDKLISERLADGTPEIPRFLLDGLKYYNCQACDPVLTPIATSLISRKKLSTSRENEASQTRT
jgi:hypothetical protein